MPEPLTILVATVACFVVGATYYALLSGPDGDETPPWKLAVEVLRCVVVAAVVGGLAVRGDVEDPAGGLLLGLALWVGFPLVLWTGAIVWEGTPLRQALLHGGDWLAKLLVVGVIVSVMQ